FAASRRRAHPDDPPLSLATLRPALRRGQLAPAAIPRPRARLWRWQEVAGPGGACTAAADRLLAGGHWSECGAPVGQAGKGTAMRTAPPGVDFFFQPGRPPPAMAQVARSPPPEPLSVGGGGANGLAGTPVV